MKRITFTLTLMLVIITILTSCSTVVPSNNADETLSTAPDSSSCTSVSATLSPITSSPENADAVPPVTTHPVMTTTLEATVTLAPITTTPAPITTVPSDNTPPTPREAKTRTVYLNDRKFGEITAEIVLKETDAMLNLPSPTHPGYTFLGWYTKSSGGELVDYIPKNTTEDYVLFAHWDIIPYTITYLDAPAHTNVKTYTVEDEIILSDPEWSGLQFVGWHDPSGTLTVENNSTLKKTVKIPKGSVGNITLTATWKRLRNTASNPSTPSNLLTEYDEAENLYYFIYNIGSLEHVVLEDIYIGGSNLKYNSKAGDLVFNLTETVAVEDAVARSIAHTVTDSFLTRSEWKDTRTTFQNEMKTNSASLSLGVEKEFVKMINGKLSGTVSGSKTDESGWKHETVTVNGTEDGSAVSDEFASTISYKSSLTNSVTTTITISKDMPEGYYSYVHAGNIRVYAVVTYDPESGYYYLNTFSVLDNMHQMLLYYRNEAELNSQTCEALSFTIPVEAIRQHVESSYQVHYDANGGNGLMPISVMKSGAEQTLSANTFTKEGYTFSGWSFLTDDTVNMYQDQEDVKDIAPKGGVVTLFAVWSPNCYTVTYNANKPVQASGAVEGLPQQAVWTYDASERLGHAPTLTGWTFGGWYLDKACTVKAGNANNILVAPNYSSLANSASTVLYAKWTPNTYSVSYHANDGSGSMASSIYTYDSAKALSPNGFSRHGWLFLGWSTSPNATSATYTDQQSVKNLATGGSVTLYAVWRIQTTFYKTFSGSLEITDDSAMQITVSLDDLDVNSLMAQGYLFTVTVSFHIKELDKGYQGIAIYTSPISSGFWNIQTDDNYKIYASGEIELGGGEKTSGYHTLTTGTFSASHYLYNHHSLYLVFGGMGKFEDDWELSELSVTVNFTK